jgi:hypothetical protein
MTVTLNLKPEVEAGLEAHAHASGMSLQEYLLSVVEEAATQADSFRHRSIARRVAQTGSPTPLQAGNFKREVARSEPSPPGVKISRRPS